jgi:dipeptidyl aminopeptidase/acylaminoacyl peptidase
LNKKSLLLVLTMAALVAFGAAWKRAVAEELTPLSAEELLRMRTPVETSPIALSPDGKWLAYTVRDNTPAQPTNGSSYVATGVRTGDRGAEIFIVNVSDRGTRKIAAGAGSSWLPTWSPDGRYLAFLSTGEGNGQASLWVWDMEEKGAKKVFDRAVRSVQIEWAPDSRKLIIGTVPDGFGVSGLADKVKSATSSWNSSFHDADGLTVRVYAAHPEEQRLGSPVTSDAWSLDSHFCDLTLVDVTTGRTAILARNERVSFFRIFKDGSHAAFSSPVQFEKPGSQQILYNLVVVTLSSGKRVVVSGIRLDLAGRFGISPDGAELSYRAGGAEEKERNIFVVSTEGGTPRQLTRLEKPQNENRDSAKSQAYDSSAALWDPSGAQLYFIHGGELWRTSSLSGLTARVASIDGRFVAQLFSASGNTMWLDPKTDSTMVITQDERAKEDGFYEINLVTGTSKKVLERGECYTCTKAAEGRSVAIGGNGQSFAYYAQDAQHSPNLWLLDGVSLSTSRVTALNPGLEKQAMGSVRIIEWLDDDGDLLRGALVLPTVYQPGQHYPLIVLVYGGQPLSNEADRFGGFERNMPCFHVQLLATRGYAVLMPDAPQRLGTPMLDLAKTILPGVNKVIEMGIGDPLRLGVMGHSYGGYSTLALITQTTRFKAAIEAAGTANIFGTYGQMDSDGTAFGVSLAETGQELLGGTPWQVRDRYFENSPFFYLDRVNTPLLILHGSEDSAIAVSRGDELFVGLRRLGKTVEYARYRGETHWILGYANQLDACNRVIAWFDKYVKGIEH